MRRRRKSLGDPLFFGRSSIPTLPGLKKTGVTSSINVIPMIDVMLALLIIAMVATPVLYQYVARTPRAIHVVPETLADAVTLGIDQDGKVYLGDGGESVPSAELERRLLELYQARPGDHLLYLRADRSVGYDLVLDVIDAARVAGVRTIGAISTPVENGAGQASSSTDASVASAAGGS